MEIIGNILTFESPITVNVPALLNAGGTPSIQSDLLANRPAAGTTGRLFVATDTGAMYRDTGAAWSLLGSSTAMTGTINQINVGGSIISIADNVVLPGTSGMTIPSGTEAEEPTPMPGMIRYNTTENFFHFAHSLYGVFNSWNGFSYNQVDEEVCRLKDDFISGVPQTATFTTLNGVLGELGWTGLNSSAVAWTEPTAQQNHPGILQLSTIATANVTALLVLGNSATTSQVFSSDLEYFCFVVNVPTITTVSVRAGFGQALTTANNGTAGIFWQFNPATSPNWQFVTRSASTSTTITTSVPVVAGAWYSLEAIYDGTTWTALVNEVVEGTSTTNIPAQALGVGVFLSPTAAVARTLQIDYFSMYTRGLSRHV